MANFTATRLSPIARQSVQFQRRQSIAPSALKGVSAGQKLMSRKEQNEEDKQIYDVSARASSAGNFYAGGRTTTAISQPQTTKLDFTKSPNLKRAFTEIGDEQYVAKGLYSEGRAPSKFEKFSRKTAAIPEAARQRGSSFTTKAKGATVGVAATAGYYGKSLVIDPIITLAKFSIPGIAIAPKKRLEEAKAMGTTLFTKTGRAQSLKQFSSLKTSDPAQFVGTLIGLTKGAELTAGSLESLGAASASKLKAKTVSQKYAGKVYTKDLAKAIKMEVEQAKIAGTELEVTTRPVTSIKAVGQAKAAGSTVQSKGVTVVELGEPIAASKTPVEQLRVVGQKRVVQESTPYIRRQDLSTTPEGVLQADTPMLVQKPVKTTRTMPVEKIYSTEEFAKLLGKGEVAKKPTQRIYYDVTERPATPVELKSRFIEDQFLTAKVEPVLSTKDTTFTTGGKVSAAKPGQVYGQQVGYDPIKKLPGKVLTEYVIDNKFVKGGAAQLEIFDSAINSPRIIDSGFQGIIKTQPPTLSQAFFNLQDAKSKLPTATIKAKPVRKGTFDVIGVEESTGGLATSTDQQVIVELQKPETVTQKVKQKQKDKQQSQQQSEQQFDMAQQENARFSSDADVGIKMVFEDKLKSASKSKPKSKSKVSEIYEPSEKYIFGSLPKEATRSASAESVTSKIRETSKAREITKDKTRPDETGKIKPREDIIIKPREDIQYDPVQTPEVIVPVRPTPEIPGETIPTEGSTSDIPDPDKDLTEEEKDALEKKLSSIDIFTNYVASPLKLLFNKSKQLFGGKL